jgi:hypothetical protein
MFAMDALPEDKARELQAVTVASMSEAAHAFERRSASPPR